MRLATFVGDWLLSHRHPDTGVLPLFPYSTIEMGKYEGGNEGAAVNITRACRTGSNASACFCQTCGADVCRTGGFERLRQ